MKIVIPKSLEQIARRKIQLATKVKQAARRAELLRESSHRVKVEMKNARRLYKHARKAARKAEKKTARLTEEFALFLETVTRHAKKNFKHGKSPGGKNRASRRR